MRIYIPWTEQTVFALAPDRGSVAEWNGPGAGWTIIGGPASAIAAGLAEVSTDTSQTSIYDGTPGDWSQIGGVSEGVFSGNAIYSVDGTGQVLDQWTGGTSWQPIFSSTGVWAVTGVGPAVLVVEANGDDSYAYNGTPYSWTQISSSPLFVAAVSRTNIYGYTNDSTNLDAADVDVYSGCGTSWTVIGGPAYQNLQGGLAAGD